MWFDVNENEKILVDKDNGLWFGLLIKKDKPEYMLFDLIDSYEEAIRLVLKMINARR